jgi:hypothetical protein
MSDPKQPLTSGSGAIETIAELEDARERGHRVFDASGRLVLGLRYGPAPSSPVPNADDDSDWAKIEAEIRAEVKERGFPDPRHHDEHWRSIRALARRYAGDEENPGPTLVTARRRIGKILQRLRREGF